jgi:predicted SAM-dependent methyltransferase
MRLFSKKPTVKDFDKLHLGCGKIYTEGFLNIGLFEDEKIPKGKIIKRNNSYIMNFNLTKEMPFNNESIRYIYSSHFIEHLTLEEGLRLCKEAYRIMQEGGVFRVSFPDLRLGIENYVKGVIDEKGPDYKFFIERYKFKPTPGMLIFEAWRHWGHKQMYDVFSMKILLKNAGFYKISEKTFRDSSMPKIEELEPEHRRLVSSYVEVER